MAKKYSYANLTNPIKYVHIQAFARLSKTNFVQAGDFSHAQWNDRSSHLMYRKEFYISFMLSENITMTAIDL